MMKVPCPMSTKVKLPFSAIHPVMKAHGFRKFPDNKPVAYRARLYDASVGRSYRLTVPVRDEDGSTGTIRMAEASIEEPGRIPASIVAAATCKLHEVITYLQNEAIQQGEPVPDSSISSGGMTPNFEEMVRLGKEMAVMKTNQMLQEEGQVPDPIQ